MHINFHSLKTIKIKNAIFNNNSFIIKNQFFKDNLHIVKNSILKDDKIIDILAEYDII